MSACKTLRIPIRRSWRRRLEGSPLALAVAAVLKIVVAAVGRAAVEARGTVTRVTGRAARPGE